MLEFIFWVFFIFIVTGYVFKLFVRYGLPWLLTRFMKNQQKKYSDPFNSSSYSGQQTTDGEVSIDRGSKKKAEKEKDDFGDYVDFEDIE